MTNPQPEVYYVRNETTGEITKREGVVPQLPYDRLGGTVYGFATEAEYLAQHSQPDARALDASKLVYVAMLTYNLTEWDNFDENFIGVYESQEAAEQACTDEAAEQLSFFYKPVRQGFWIAEVHSYLPPGTTWFYIFKSRLHAAAHTSPATDGAGAGE